MRKNCAAALRTLTLNPSTRPYLLNESNAIAIILEDNQSKGMGMSDRLARKIETESWANGGEDTTREGRAAEVANATVVRLPMVYGLADATADGKAAADAAVLRRRTKWFKITEPVRILEPMAEASDQMPRPPDLESMPQAMGLDRDFPLQAKAFPKVFLDHRMRSKVTEPLVGRPSELMASVALHADDEAASHAAAGAVWEGGARDRLAPPGHVGDGSTRRNSFDGPVLRESIDDPDLPPRGKPASEITAAWAESRSKVRFAAESQEQESPPPDGERAPEGRAILQTERRGSRSAEEISKFKRNLSKASRPQHRRSVHLKTLLKSAKSLALFDDDKRSEAQKI